MRVALEAFPRVLEEQLGIASAAAEALAEARRIEEILHVAKAMAEAGLDLQRLRGEAQRLREALQGPSMAQARLEAENLCRRLTGHYLASRIGRSVEPDTCLSQRDVELIEALLRAAGPAKDVVRSLLAAASASQVKANAATLARAWRSLAPSLSRLVHSAAMLERNAEVKAASLLAAASMIAEKAPAEQAVALLEALSTGLARAAAAAEEISRLTLEVSEASRVCGPQKTRLPCRLLDEAAAKLAEARAELQRLRRIEAPEDAEAAARLAEARLREARRSLEAISRLYSRIAGGASDSLAERVETLLRELQRQALSQEEEEALHVLATRDTVDLMELHSRSPRLSRAALRLCLRGLAHCTVAL